jgi:hypothetical protein
MREGPSGREHGGGVTNSCAIAGLSFAFEKSSRKDWHGVHRRTLVSPGRTLRRRLNRGAELKSP